VEGKSRIPSIFDLISRLSLITIRTYENQNAYQFLRPVLRSLGEEGSSQSEVGSVSFSLELGHLATRTLEIYYKL
jgi:hypothetical protein